MNTYLYLDTARLGQMCPEAQRADRDFARLAGDEGGSLYYDLFLQAGFYSLPPSLRSKYPGLADWSGVPALKDRIKAALGLSRNGSVLLANRTAQLARLAARALCCRCENILVTDMLWPGYRRILEDECRKHGRRLTTVSLRAAILRQHVAQTELIEQLADRYRQENCDGMVLSAVTYQGIRMPVREISQAVTEVSSPAFVVVDAAQAVSHAPLDIDSQYCDLLIAGCHKWMRAYHPLGFGLCCRPSAEAVIEHACRDMRQQGELDDPLLALTTELEIDDCEPFSETVNLAPLFTASAAVGRLWHASRSRCEEFSAQLQNTNRATEITEHTGWLPVRPEIEMRSGILLLQSKHADTRSAPPETLRFAFRRRGVALSAYAGGLIRASLPPINLPANEFSQLRFALQRCA
jgi:hypothetical protein